MTGFVACKVIGGGVLKLERVQVICPAYGQQVEAVATDGRVKGYCAVAKQSVDFLIETQRIPTGKQLTTETRAKLSASLRRGLPARELMTGATKSKSRRFFGAVNRFFPYLGANI